MTNVHLSSFLIGENISSHISVQQLGFAVSFIANKFTIKTFYKKIQKNVSNYRGITKPFLETVPTVLIIQPRVPNFLRNIIITESNVKSNLSFKACSIVTAKAHAPITKQTFTQNIYKKRFALFADLKRLERNLYYVSRTAESFNCGFSSHCCLIKIKHVLISEFCWYK